MMKRNNELFILRSEREKLSYSIYHLVLYSARRKLGVKSVHFSLNQVEIVKLQHFPWVNNVHFSLDQGRKN